MITLAIYQSTHRLHGKISVRTKALGAADVDPCSLAQKDQVSFVFLIINQSQ